VVDEISQNGISHVPVVCYVFRKNFDNEISRNKNSLSHFSRISRNKQKIYFRDDPSTTLENLENAAYKVTNVN
jgi:hypothetical protein